MSYHRPTRITITDEEIRDAVMAELLSFFGPDAQAGLGIIRDFSETDSATIAHNVIERLTKPAKVSDITGFPEDDAGHDPTPTQKLRRKANRIPGIPGQGNLRQH
jgi:hypothetical protein